MGLMGTDPTVKDCADRLRPMQKTKWESLLLEGSEVVMEINVLPVGGLVYVTCYGPCWGLRGIICAIDAIALADAQEEPLYFYLVALQEGQMKEPVWFIHDDVAGVEGDNVSQWRPNRKAPSRLEIEAMEIVAKGFEQDRNVGTL